ncbi:hypothetical protein IJO12_00970 [bacterium]|nr:hypothetical protein [bacterium]
MKVSAISSGNSSAHNKSKQQSAPTFKNGGGFLNFVGSVMQIVESQGYFASFLIQDTIGMTIPRTLTGFSRDKEITGKLNRQEGKEVFLREGLTGPYMMLVAPAMLWLTTKFCRSTNTNSNLIKRYGESLKNFVKDSKINKSVMADKDVFKEKFALSNIEKIYKNTVKNDTNPKEAIDYLMKEFKNLSSKDKKIRNSSVNNMVNKINEKIISTSDDLYTLNRLEVGENANKKVFNSKEAILALSDFCEDAIVKNPDSSKLTEETAVNIKNNLLTRRALTNIGNLAVTLIGLSFIPKLYAKNDVSPSMNTLKHMQTNSGSVQNDNNADNIPADNAQEKTPSFKGRGINKNGIFAKIGNFLSKTVPEKFSQLFEYVGHNFTKSTFAALSVFGLLTPRGIRAVKRAPVDEKGKRDRTELNEILLRDTTSSLTVIFAVPILTKLFVKAYENNLGFVLTNNASQGKSPFKKFIDVINPYSQLEVLSLADLDSIYGNIDSKGKLMNFAKFVDKNNGDLEKILSKSENSNLLFNEKTFTLNSIKKLSKAEKNKKIIEVFNKIEAPDLKAKNDVIKKVMQGTGDIKSNKIMQTVRGLNALPTAIATFVISPILLGIIIPKITYRNTRKTHEKMLADNNKN